MHGLLYSGKNIIQKLKGHPISWGKNSYRITDAVIAQIRVPKGALMIRSSVTIQAEKSSDLQRDRLHRFQISP
jgi:hypothetical protein